LVKLALEKEKKQSKVQGRAYNPLNGVKALIETHAVTYMKKFECQSWRDDRYWFEENEKILTKNETVLMDAYKTFGKAIVIGKPKTLAMPDFISMITATEIVDDTFGAREIGTLFNLSMQTQIDEIHNRKHIDMSYLEFCEALARVADKAFEFVPSNYA
jgi:NLR family CARD domain-containing protein 3